MFRINTGTHRRSSVQSQSAYYSYVGDHAWRAPATADASRPHRSAVGVDAALLGPESSLTPGSCGSLAIPSHLVSFSDFSIHPFVSLTVIACSGPPVWKRLISGSLSTHERVSLITSIFSDDDEVEAIGQVSGEGAQNFVDVVYEASLLVRLSPKGGSVTSHQNFRALSVRC
jgi:hypothetical protein